MLAPIGCSLEDVAGVAGRVEAWRGRHLEVAPLAGGITNRNFVVTVDGGERYVVRFPGERTELLGIDRAGERQAALRAAQLGIGPPVLAEALPDVGTVITALVTGEHRTGDAFVDRLDDVVDLVRRLHDSAPLDHAFPIHGVIEAHARDARRLGVAPPSAGAALLAQAARIEAAFARSPDPPVPCHNDLLPANVLFSDTRAWLLDFEYAGNNDRWFDLGNLSVNAALHTDAEEALLRRYLGGPPTARHRARLQLMKVMSELREGMWATVQRAISTLDTDFDAYARERLTSAARLTADPAYERWLADAA
jgi:thiamine kinase-like enzyme